MMTQTVCDGNLSLNEGDSASSCHRRTPAVVAGGMVRRILEKGGEDGRRL